MFFCYTHNSRAVFFGIKYCFSPQFHCVYDDHFSTVGAHPVDVQAFNAHEWDQLIASGHELVWGAEFDGDGLLLNPPPELDDSWLNARERHLRDTLRTARRSCQREILQRRREREPSFQREPPTTTRLPVNPQQPLLPRGNDVVIPPHEPPSNAEPTSVAPPIAPDQSSLKPATFKSILLNSRREVCK